MRNSRRVFSDRSAMADHYTSIGSRIGWTSIFTFIFTGMTSRSLF